MMVPRKRKPHSINWWCWVPPKVYSHLYCFHSIELKVVLTALLPDGLSEISPMRVVSSAIFNNLMDWLLEIQL